MTPRRPGGGARAALPLLLLAAAVLAPYHALVTGAALPVPDDVFVSDLADAELPARVEAARLLRAGEAPLWTPRILTGAPLSVDPLSLALFALLPPALALGWLISLLLLAAAFGAFALARLYRASLPGAFLAGFAYAWSGVLVCQLRHLAILGTVALFPVALLCLERAAAASRAADGRAATIERLRWLLAFAAVFGLQALFGFPQSAYTCALVYGALVVARAARLFLAPAGGPGPAPRARPALELALGAAAALGIGTLLGMSTLLPLWDLAALSDRSGAGTFEWATHFSYDPRSWVTFFAPYARGDISDLTYRGTGVFWEDYGYLGLATVLLAGLATAARWRRFPVAFWAATALVAYLLVLGKATPLYRLAHEWLPGLDRFRFPTRFLFVVELALALLGGLGLSFLQRLLARRLPRRWPAALPRVAAALLVTVTVADLVHHNRRQNPLADASRWLATPATAARIAAGGGHGRVFTPGVRALHVAAFGQARGWSGDLAPYYAHRELLQPDSNLLHGVATLDGYTGIAPRWTVDLVGDHNRAGFLDRLYTLSSSRFSWDRAFFPWLEALSVGWVILPVRTAIPGLEHVGSFPPAELYRLPNALPRARIAGRARLVASPEELDVLTQSGALDPRRVTLLHEPGDRRVADELARRFPDGAAPGAARIVVDRASRVVVEASAPRGGLLVLADAYSPGWEAALDGRPVPILRANLAQRAVELPPGEHRVEFRYRPRAAALGLALSLAALALLAAAALALRRAGAAGRPLFPGVSPHPRMQREAKTVCAMIDLACSQLHGTPAGELCAGCVELREYSLLRLAKCPFQEGKTSCGNCRVHCYRPDMRERARQVMRTAGPRMPLRHPAMSFWHLLDGLRRQPRRRPGRPGADPGAGSPGRN